MDCQPHDNQQVYIWSKNNQTCLLCDEPSDNPHPLCSPCESELPWLLDYCQTCALPLPVAGLTCGQCLKRPPSFEQVIAPWTYHFPVDSLITRFKHQSQWPLGRLLGELLALALRERFDHGLPRPDLLLPVPMAVKRQRQRGYNQAAMLMNWLGKCLQISGDEHRLLRIQDTVAQQELDARARRRNLQNAFALAPGASVEGLHLALVDDVLTTGATAESLARLLLRAGARRVDVYCLARTPKPGEPA
ncbi:ComF family protein [Pseudomonas fuscovaginae UPB0736]|uniref:ComF family protein n=1 Tax=Pseudomonas asplenii TaxID=53407 RepID=UPI000288DF7E|nr:ComF family protein [Pseudomonas fuscovaginae]UUQ62851.1 ComF family protein [Pseudomonas fuscovaginae UPB0736]